MQAWVVQMCPHGTFFDARTRPIHSFATVNPIFQHAVVNGDPFSLDADSKRRLGKTALAGSNIAHIYLAGLAARGGSPTHRYRDQGSEDKNETRC